MSTAGERAISFTTREPVFLATSGRARDPAFDSLDDYGWNVLPSSEGGAAADFVVGTSTVAIVDLREGMLPQLAELGRVIEARRSAMLVVVPASSGALLAAAVDAGATHQLAEPFDTVALDAALCMAERFVDRLRYRSERRIKLREERRFTARAEPTPAIDPEATLRRDIQSRTLLGPTEFMMIGLKRFDMINSAFGRATGDSLLEAVAERIDATVYGSGSGDALVARASGADFIVVPSGMSAAASVDLANKIIARLERPFMANGHMITIGASIGMVAAGQGEDTDELMQRASVALSNGRDADRPVTVLSAAEEGAAVRDVSLASDLRRALDNDEIEVLFQPQVSVTTGEVMGVEALARWRHPDHGELGAVTLFAVAERSDYLTALSAHVQRRAASMAATWPASLSKLRLSINLTAADIAGAGFVEGFLAMIDASGFPRNRLTVEITESGLIEDLSIASSFLAALRRGGCRVAIDDFGTGYSSLAYLKALPLDYLKIDKHLAQDIIGTTRDRVVVRGVIDMARSLGLSVVAEGVETEEQLTLLAREGCNYYQGFLFSGAVGVPDLKRLVAGLLAPGFS